MYRTLEKVDIGQADNKSVYWDRVNSPNSHIALIGGSGSGKTVQAQKIICELVKAGETAVVIDLHGTFVDDQIFAAYKEFIDGKRNDIDVYNTGIPCRLFDKIKFSDGSEEHETDTVGAVTDVLCRSLNLGTKQRTVLRFAIQNVMSSGMYQEDGFQAIGEALQKSGDKISLELYERMLPLFEHNVFTDGDDLIRNNRINIIHLGKLDLATQEIVAEMILSHIWRLGNADQFKQNPVYVFVDECQNMDTSSKGPLALMISEGRRMGINLILATQMILANTKNAVQQRISQCGLILYFRPASNRVTLTAKMICPANEHQWLEILRDLKIGEFVATGSFLLRDRKISYPLKVSAYNEKGNEIKRIKETKIYQPFNQTRGMVRSSE